jgi:hypothetical protein
MRVWVHLFEHPEGGEMSDPQDIPQSAIKDPDDWKTGDEPPTGAQRSYLETLATEAGEQAPETPTKAEASKKIDELQEKTGRGA